MFLTFKSAEKHQNFHTGWPYDFFSLVEFAKVELELDYKARDITDKIQQLIPGNINQNNILKNQKVRGNKKKL